MHLSSFSESVSSDNVPIVKELNILLADLCLTSFDEIVQNVKTCCDIKQFLNEVNQQLSCNPLTFEKNNPLMLGISDFFIVLCNARIIELYVNSQYDSSKKGLRLCEKCTDTNEFEYFHIFKPDSRNDKIEIKLLGLSEHELPTIYNIWSLLDKNLTGKDEPETNNSNINWLNVGRMLHNSNFESKMNPSVLNLFETVKKHAQMTMPISGPPNANVNIVTTLNNITNQLNRLEFKVDAIYNHLFPNRDQDKST